MDQNQQNSDNKWKDQINTAFIVVGIISSTLGIFVSYLIIKKNLKG